MTRCIACGALAQPDIDYCLECDVELCEQFDEARDYAELRDELTDSQPYHCANSAQAELEF